MPTPDLSEFEQLSQRSTTKRPCQVATARDKIDETDHPGLEAALAAPKERITTGAIRAWFERRGQKVSLPAIVSHRTGRCKCTDE